MFLGADVPCNVPFKGGEKCRQAASEASVPWMKQNSGNRQQGWPGRAPEGLGARVLLRGGPAGGQQGRQGGARKRIGARVLLRRSARGGAQGRRSVQPGSYPHGRDRPRGR